MSGHYSNRAGTWHTIMGRSLLKEGETTLGEVFADNGYATGLFGKWHLGDNFPFRPEDRGFQEVVRHGGGGVGQTPDFWDNSYFDDTYFHNGVPKKYQGFCTDVFFDEAMRFIRESAAQEKPFFAFVSTNAPHGPFHCPDEYWKPYLKKGVTEREAIFFGMIANIDENVERMRKELDEMGIADNTIFIFTTDNGTASGQAIYNAGMRGIKGSPYDGGHRVPFIMHWPNGGLDTGRDVDRLSAHIDVLPTLIDLCGLDYPMDYQFDGRSLAPLIYEMPTTWPDRVIITDSQRVVDPFKWRASAVMTDRWRLINGIELYDMDKDSSQGKDVSNRYPSVVQRLRSEYEQWWDSISPTFKETARIRLGNEAENPTYLTCHDWLNDNGGIPWNQGYVRTGYPGMGVWAVHVDEPGRYEVLLQRWPTELNRPIRSPLKPGEPVPGLEAMREKPGRAIEADKAVLYFGDYSGEVLIGKKDVAARFVVDLEAGDQRLKGYFKMPNGEGKSVGAFYAIITKL